MLIYGGLYRYIAKWNRLVYPDTQETTLATLRLRTLATLRCHSAMKHDDVAIILAIEDYEAHGEPKQFAKIITKDGIIGRSYWYPDEWEKVKK
jgi:hypothetical protein